jgi:uncharacterized cofD-like protein
MASSKTKVVTIGGGGGSVQLLQGLRKYTQNLTGVIAVTDNGRSTGRARDILNIPAPGDIRNALGTLAQDQSIMPDVIQYRLNTPGYPVLDGMAFGNLLLGVLAHTTGDFVKAVDLLREMLKVTVKILPVTESNTHLYAELADGSIAEGEFQVRGLDKAPIKRVYLKDKEARAYAETVEAVRQADLIVMGPGSLFTTVVACLVFEDLAKAVRESNAPTVYVCNTTTQPGQTDGFSISDHVYQILSYLGPGGLDYVIINTKMPPPELVEGYAKDKVYVLQPTAEELKKVELAGVKVLARDVALLESKRDLYQKQDSIRHDPEVVAEILMTLIEKPQKG